MSDFLEICVPFYVLHYFISCGLSNINHFFSVKIKFVQRDPFMCLTASFFLEIFIINVYRRHWISLLVDGQYHWSVCTLKLEQVLGRTF